MDIDLSQYMITLGDTKEATPTTVNDAQVSNDSPNNGPVDPLPFGVTPNGNTVGFTELNKRMDAAGIGADAQQRYDVQQAWLKNLDRQIELESDPALKQQWQEDKEWVLERALKEDSTLGAKLESIGKGFDQFQAGTSFMGAYATSHLDKTDGEIFDEIKKENAEKYAQYLKAEEHLDKLAGAYSTTDAYDIEFGASGSGQDEFIRSIYKKKLSKEEQDLIDWFHNEFEAKRTAAVFGDDANKLTKWLSNTGIENIVEASKKSQYVGREERRDKIRNAADETDGLFSSVWKTAKASWLDLDAAFDLGMESTGSQLIPQLAAIIGGGVIAKNPMVYQTIASLGNFPAEVQGAVVDKLQELASKKYKKSMDQLTPDEIKTVIQENRADFSKAMDDGLKSATVIAVTEPLVAKGVGKVASQFSKLAQKVGNKSAVLEWLGYGAEAALEFTGEGWEEAFGQIASNIALGKRWDEGVGQSFVQALFSAEQVPNYVATVKDVTNNLRGEADSNQKAKTQEQTGGKPETSQPKLDPDLERAKQLQADLDRNLAGEYVNHMDDTGIIVTPELVQQQRDENNAAINEIMVKKNFDPNDENSRRAFYDLLYGNTTVETSSQGQDNAKAPTGNTTQEQGNIKSKEEIIAQATPLYEKQERGERLTETEDRQLSELEEQYADLTTIDNDGIQAHRYLSVDWDAQQRSKANESGSIDRNGSQNADGSSVEQGINEPNGSGTESRGEISTTIPPIKTETSTAGDSQSNTGATTDFTGEPNNNSQTGNTARANGRTGETDNQPREQGELGQNRSNESGEPTQGPSAESTSSRVSERAKSDSVGETLNQKPVFDESKQIADYKAALTDSNLYQNSDKNMIDSEIEYSAKALKQFVEQGDTSNVDRELNYLRHAYARKEQLTGISQEEDFLKRAKELTKGYYQEESTDKTHAMGTAQEVADQQQGDKVSKYEFGLKKKNKDSVTFTEHSDGAVFVELHTSGGVFRKTLQDLDTAKAWVDQTLIGTSKKQWANKRIKVAGDGVFGESSQSGQSNTQSKPQQERRSFVSDERATDNAPSDTTTRSETVEQGRTAKSEWEDPSKKGSLVERTNFTSKKNFQEYAKQLMNDTPAKDVAKVSNKLADLVWQRGITINGKQISEKTAKELHTYVTRLDPKTHNAENTTAREEATTRAKEKARKEVEANQQAILDRPYQNQATTMQNFLANGEPNGLIQLFRRGKGVERVLNEDVSRFVKGLPIEDKRKLADGLKSAIENTGYKEQTKQKVHKFADELKGETDKVITPKERLQYPKDYTDEDIQASKDRMDKFRESVKAKQEKSAKKDEPTQQPMAEAHKRESDVTRKMNEATAMMAEDANPFLAKIPGKDLREDQKIAHELYKKYKGDEAKVEQIKEAFIKKHPGRWADNSWEAAKRGGFIVPLRKDQYNNLVADAVTHNGAKAGDLVRFDGTVVKKDGVVAKVDNDLFDEIQDHPIESQVVEIVNHLETNTSETVEVAIDLAEQSTGVSVDDVKEEIFKKKPDYFIDDNLQPLVNGEGISNDQLANVANPEVLKKYFSNISAKAKAFLDTFHKAIASVLAIVAVASMTVPHDAMAQQGFSTYTQGETIQGVSQEASNTINWVMQHKDHNGKNFVVADKDQGKIHIVSPDGKVLNTQNALFGKGRGNDNSDMNTPSGRMQLKKETNLNKTEKGIYGDSVLEFVDPYTKAAVKQKGGGIIAMHRVVNTPARKAALNSVKASDNFLSHGCVNIPTAFYNTAVDSLNGAMVYVLDHKDAKPSQQAKEVKPVTTQSGTNYSKSGQTSHKTGLKAERSGLKAERSGLKLSADGIRDSIAEVNYEELGLSKEEVKKALKKTLGKLADRVTLINRDDFERFNADYAYINRNGIEGFFDPETGHVFLVADQIKKGNGLTAAERAAWVGWHELTHAGLNTKYGEDLTKTLENVQDDPFVSQIANAIQQKRASRNDSPAHVTKLGATEEALAEINAAVRTGNLKSLSERYGVFIPAEYSDFAKEVSTNFLQKLRNLFNKVLGRKAIVSNNQVIDLLRSLPQEIENYAPVASRAVTEKILLQLNNPESAYNQAKYSIGDTVAETTKKAANYILGSTIYRNKHVLNRSGVDPAKLTVGERQTEIIEQSLNPMEKFIEGMYDSQIAALKHLGGLTSRYGQMLKTATNRTARVKRHFQMKEQQLLSHMEKVAKKAYDRKHRVAIQSDLQTVTTCLGAITGINTQMAENRERSLYDPNYGLEAQLQALGVDLTTGVASQVGSSWQAKKISDLWVQYNELKAIQEKTTKSVNRIMSEKYARNGEDPARMSENIRVYDGMTTALAFNHITKAVKQGLIDVKIKGKPWLDYINDVGFTEDQGFADESRNYDIDQNDVELSGHFAPLIDEYTTLAQSVYKYKEQHLGKALAGESFNNRFEVPTMGKVESLKYNQDSDGNFIVKKDKTVEDKIALDEATEYQGKRLGRATSGGNVISNLNALIDLTAQQTQYQPLFKALYNQRNDKNAVGIKVIEMTDPEYNVMKGAILHVDILGSNGKPTGKKKYVKVVLDNDEATAALFGDNVQELNLPGFNLIRAVNKIVTMSLTGNPIFSFYNALRSLWEKLDQISSQFGKNNDYFMDAINQSNTKTAQIIKSNNAVKSFLRKPILTAIALSKLCNLSYFKAASAMAFFMADKSGKYKHGNRLTGKSLEAYNRLMAAYNQGTITTRAESTQLSPDELAVLYKSYNGKLSTVFGTTFLSMPRKAVTWLDHIQEYSQFLTSAGELMTSLVVQDILTEAGMDVKKANEANLYFMNFNDRGASKFSSYLRASIPFANAAAQGNRSTIRSLTRKGIGVILYGAVSSYLLQELATLLQEAAPCETDVSDNPFENRNDAELQRDIPFRMGCSGDFRLPIGYGIGAISHAMGVGIYQLVHSNWSWKQTLQFVGHNVAENLLPVPLVPDSKSSIGSVAIKSIMPAPTRTIWNLYSGIDDFGNDLNSPAAKGKAERFKYGKKSTPSVWGWLAEKANVLGFNPTPEEMRYFVQSIAGEIPTSLINESSRDLKDDESRIGAILFGIAGTKRMWRKERTPGQDSYIRATNLQERYSDLTKVIDSANQGGQLKYGKRDSNLYSWIDDQRETGKYTERELEMMEIIGEFKREQKRISSSKKLSAEEKDERHYENNKQFIEAMRPFNRGEK